MSNACLIHDLFIAFIIHYSYLPIDFISFSNLSPDPQANNDFYNCIDSAPDIPDAKAVPLGLDMVCCSREK